MKSKTKRSSRKKSSKKNSQKNHGTLPLSSEIKKLLAFHKFDSAEPIAVNKLKNVFRTYIIKIVKHTLSYAEKNNHKISDIDVTNAIVQLFGEKFAANVAFTSKDEKQFTSNRTFNKMLKECLELLVAKNKKPSSFVSTYIHKAAEMALVKGFISPIRFWHKADADLNKTKKKSKMTMKLLTRVNQVHFMSDSEFFSPSLTTMV